MSRSCHFRSEYHRRLLRRLLDQPLPLPHSVFQPRLGLPPLRPLRLPLPLFMRHRLRPVSRFPRLTSQLVLEPLLPLHTLIQAILLSRFLPQNLLPLMGLNPVKKSFSQVQSKGPSPNKKGLSTENKKGLRTENKKGLRTENKKGLRTENKKGLRTEGLSPENKSFSLTPPLPLPLPRPRPRHRPLPRPRVYKGLWRKRLGWKIW